MGKGLVSFAIGIAVGYHGVRLVTHAVYLAIIVGLATAVYFK